MIFHFGTAGFTFPTAGFHDFVPERFIAFYVAGKFFYISHVESIAGKLHPGM